MSLIFPALLIIDSGKAIARIVDDVIVRSRPAGYEIRTKFIIPMRLIKHQPKSRGDVLLVELRPVSGLSLDSSETLEQLGERKTLSWDRSTGVPLKEINFDDDSPDRPKVIFRFKKTVEFDLRTSADLRNLIVFIYHKPEDEKQVQTPVLKQKGKRKDLEKDSQKFQLSFPESKIAEWMDEAKSAMTSGNYRRAIQLYTKILNSRKTKYHQDAQEFLGLARARNNQFAHAKSEYEKYLGLYPEGPGAERVRQRLNGLLTSRDKPKEKLREARRPVDSEKSEWDTQYFGSLSMFYNHDVSDQDNGESNVNRSDLTTDVDLNARFRSEDYEFRGQFVGGQDADFRAESSPNETDVRTMTLEGKALKKGLYARFGRQFQSTGGVLGRFDGAWMSYDITPKVKANGVFGFPVDFSSSEAFDTTKHFYGINFDLGTFADHWDFNVYAINQEVNGINDRRAVGGEIRFFHPKGSFLNLVDYDINYNNLNLFIVSGDAEVISGTRVFFNVDYRKSPLLTTSNAIQGQGVEEVSDLLNIFSEAEVRQLAEDRTATSKSLTVGVTQDLNRHHQLNGELTVSEINGTPASGGVPANPSTGTEFFYNLQLISSDLIKSGDISIVSLRYSDLQNVDSYSTSWNVRFPLTQNFRINPRVRVDYRKNKQDGGDRWNFRPLLRLDYRFERWLRLEAEGGREWINETALGNSQKTTSYFFSVGFRAFF